MITLLILLVLTSCSKTEVINTPQMQSVDTLLQTTKAHKPLEKPQRDTVSTDTTRIPIRWNPIVKDWHNDYNSEQNL